MSGLLRGFIPRYIGAGAVLGFLRLFSFGLPGRVRAVHLAKNRSEWNRLHTAAMTGRYIERQSALGAMVLGNTRASINSCEVIAVYNALAVLEESGSGLAGDMCDFPELLAEFERRGVVFFGAFGTAPARLKSFLRDKGFDCTELRGRRITGETVGQLAASHRVFILTQYNDKDDIFAMIHTMCITREDDGYVVHNGGHPNSTFPSLYAAITGIAPDRAGSLCLIGAG